MDKRFFQNEGDNEPVILEKFSPHSDSLNYFQVITQKPKAKDDVTIRVSDTVPNLGPVDEHKTEFNRNGDINIFVHEKRLGDRNYSGDPLHDLGWRTEIKVNSIGKLLADLTAQEKINLLLESDLTSYRIAAQTDMNVSSIVDMRNGKHQVPNLRLETAEKLISYFNGLVDDTL